MKKIITAVAVILGLSAGANALDVNGKLEVGYGLYSVMPVSTDFKDAMKSGMGMNFYGDYRITDQFTAGLEIGYGLGQELKANSAYDLMHTMVGLRGKYVMPMDFGASKGSVYGILGLASYMWSYDPSIANVDDETNTGLSLGGGIDMELNPEWKVGFELRYHVVKIGNDDGNFLAPMLKIGYNF